MRHSYQLREIQAISFVSRARHPIGELAKAGFRSACLPNGFGKPQLIIMGHISIDSGNYRTLKSVLILLQ
jgi:hypothetical protein